MMVELVKPDLQSIPTGVGWRADRRRRRARRRLMIAIDRMAARHQVLQMRVVTRISADDCDCDIDEMIEPGVMYTDGDIIPCPNCGHPWMVSCDTETEPHLIECEASP